MNFALAQNQKYEGDDWWKWSLWIEGSGEELDRIEAVTYTLHPTFSEPVRIITDRGTKFQLKCAGWGVFKIPVEVRLKGGKTLRLEHDLQLSYPETSTGAA